MSTESTADSIASVAADWTGRGSHVDFGINEIVPLQQGRFLGHGVNGGVYETTCRGVALAWKRRYCRGVIGSEERKEIEILKKLSHRHIIQLVDPAKHEPRIKGTLDHFSQLGLKLNSIFTYRKILNESFGCLAQAIAYLHEQRIRHKDLKPSNILLYREGLRVTDFGTSTDFSALTVSLTENGERGTPKYFAPEVAAFKANGRAADMFSLGCIFLEMLLQLVKPAHVDGFRALRPEDDHSFQANLHMQHQWYELLDIRGSVLQRLLAEIKMMIAVEPNQRPTAVELVEHLTLIRGFGKEGDPMLWGACCAPAIPSLSSAAAAIDDLQNELHGLTKELELARQDAKLAREDANLLKTQNARLTSMIKKAELQNLALREALAKKSANTEADATRFGSDTDTAKTEKLKVRYAELEAEKDAW
ncbi:hypothetical protein H2201_006676 [Coniosporium apollinis]|uniref:Protein kinase domain-containing protein n=1 Tax=Coniosporium apollinis TaxID=61459 RepID=A0ABQ9NQH1_9PEZI|nr:hypothetical protein H2201_006676 [Coniosporium apollinis]